VGEGEGGGEEKFIGICRANVSEKREIKGFWWTPDKPEHRLFGILTLETGEGANLETLAEGSFSVEAFNPTNQVIHGHDQKTCQSLSSSSSEVKSRLLIICPNRSKSAPACLLIARLIGQYLEFANRKAQGF
jgi:hypothetical protein